MKRKIDDKYYHTELDALNDKIISYDMDIMLYDYDGVDIIQKKLKYLQSKYAKREISEDLYYRLQRRINSQKWNYKSYSVFIISYIIE